MQHPERECPQCGDPYTGRADKQFCSDACKAQSRRNNLDNKTTDDEDVDDDDVYDDDEDDEDWDAENDDWDDDEDDEDEGVKPIIPLHKWADDIDNPPSSIVRLKSSEEERDRFNATELARLKQLRVEAQLLHEASERARQAAEKAREEAEAIRTAHNLYSTLIRKCLKQDGQELDDDDLGTWIEELDEACDKYLINPALSQPDNKAHKRLKDLYWLRDMFSSDLAELREQQNSFFKQVEPVFLNLPLKRKARFRDNLIA